ncbi:8-oxo-dGTP diphosphatase [Saccharopolyspora kobensis]|uniref:8-oxo-dGTP diphosphatase n=1 Tax=Saccharopolyspora kobensis TaxID=146035 RepID=A0A1H6E6L6_9PSEU|nr:NUDIX domain-containing protein [Saccharopolyspora kobensis]SEG92901.1 8-oxo-dGTP diphosphatase [Saccharopolyspora kobensis]SFD41145.1 8-oxo-dGTP diphosphatase [Saccharopolyspora kobensis]
MHLADMADLTRHDAADGVEQQIVAALIDVDGRALLVRRCAEDSRGGEWEFPGGKVDPGEDLTTALHREVREETGLRVKEITGYLGAFDYTTKKGRFNRQHTWSVLVEPVVEVRLTEHDAYAWVAKPDEYPLGPELAEILEKYLGSEL